MSVSPDAKPKLPRGVRLTHNEAQGGWVLLAPERVFKADAIAAEIVKRCTGEATVSDIVDDLAKTFNAPRERIETDVTAMLTGLADKRLIETLMDATPQRAPRPLGLLAELTHRCPLGCPYCSNPLALEGRADELDTASWARVFREAAALGVLQVHLSGGEPAARRDLVEITRAAHDAGLYTNLITSAVGIAKETFAKLSDAGLDHVQISIQDNEPGTADHIAGYKGAYARKQALAAEVTRLGIPLTVNAVMHRANIDHVERDGRAGVDARRQAGRDRACAVLRLGAEEPRAADADARAGRSRRASSRKTAQAASRADRDRRRGAGLLRALPESLRRRLGRRSLNVTPSGKVLPCHAAESIPGLTFWNVREHSLADIWDNSPAFHGVSRHRLDAGALPLMPEGERRISAAAAARPSRSPATPARPIRCAISRRIMRWSANWPRCGRTRHTITGADFCLGMIFLRKPVPTFGITPLSACSRATPRFGRSRPATAASGRVRARP